MKRYKYLVIFILFLLSIPTFAENTRIRPSKDPIGFHKALVKFHADYMEKVRKYGGLPGGTKHYGHPTDGLPGLFTVESIEDIIFTVYYSRNISVGLSEVAKRMQIATWALQNKNQYLKDNTLVGYQMVSEGDCGLGMALIGYDINGKRDINKYKYLEKCLFENDLWDSDDVRKSVQYRMVSTFLRMIGGYHGSRLAPEEYKNERCLISLAERKAIHKESAKLYEVHRGGNKVNYADIYRNYWKKYGEPLLECKPSRPYDFDRGKMLLEKYGPFPKPEWEKTMQVINSKNLEQWQAIVAEEEKESPKN